MQHSIGSLYSVECTLLPSELQAVISLVFLSDQFGTSDTDAETWICLSSVSECLANPTTSLLAPEARSLLAQST
jgi:hypothetical protein